MWKEYLNITRILERLLDREIEVTFDNEPDRIERAIKEGRSNKILLNNQEYLIE